MLDTIMRSALTGKAAIAVIILIAALMGGCASPAGSGIAPPPKYLMTSPRNFSVKAGDRADEKLVQCAEVRNRNARQVRGLQQYIKTSRAN